MREGATIGGVVLADGLHVVVMVVVFGLIYVSLKTVLDQTTKKKSESIRRRRRAWLLTGVSSLAMSLLGIWWVMSRLVWNGLSEELSRDEDWLDRGAVKMFIAYCIADLVLGSVEYVEVIDWESGWTHHGFYAISLYYLLWRGHTHLFTAGLIQEVPTVILAWSRLVGDDEEEAAKKAKHHRRWPFAVAYFATRILYHTVATFESLTFSTFAFLLGLIVLRQHLWWFAAWWRGAFDHPGEEQEDIANGSTSSKVPKGIPKERLSLRLKLALLASMILVQIITTAHVAVASYHKRMWLVSRFFGAIGLMATVIGLTFQTAAIFVDTYTRHFIQLAIAERQVIYNISWEDPRVEREALKLGSDDVVLTISSAGCNVLDYLVELPKCIVAADLNEAQLAVLDLKLACIDAGLPHADFFALWGRSNAGVFKQSYESTLRPRLRREASKDFWDEQGESLFRDNFMFCGTSGLVAFLLMLAARPLGISGALQRNLGAPHRGLADSAILRGIAGVLAWPSVWTYAAPLVGVPPEQVRLVERAPELFSVRVLEILEKRMWLQDNYFYHGYCTGQFDEYPKCPRYMAKEHYEKLVSIFSHKREANLAERVILFHGSWGDAPVPEGTDGYTFVSLLDSMDWMPPKLASGLVSNVVDRLAPPSADNSRPCIFWRSYAPGPSMHREVTDLFTPHTPVLAHLEPRELTDYDRVGWYLSQWVARPRPLYPNTTTAQALLPSGEHDDKVYENSLLDDIRVCLAMAVHALRTHKDVATFYKSQGPRYDGFREALLPDRDTLLRFALPWARLPSIVAKNKPLYALACVGCGTARDLEFVASHLAESCRKTKTRIALVDLSPELLAIAKSRVQKLGIADLVDYFCADLTKKDSQLHDKLKHNVAFVTCSYCLTMIPNWQGAIDALISFLIPKNGFIGLVDFTQRFNKEGTPLELIYKQWFALDGVYFNRSHVTTLVRKTKPYFYQEDRSRVPYTPFFPTHYVYVGTNTS